MKQSYTNRLLLPVFIFITLIVSCITNSHAQNLLSFLENCDTDCYNCNGSIKKIVTKQRATFNDFRSPMISKTNEYNANEQITKTEVKIGKHVSNTIYYHYIDSLLIYEHHVTPGTKDYFLVYQYYQKRLPTRIVKVDKKRNIINYSDIIYSNNEEPVYLKLYNLTGELLAKRSVEYYSKNQVVIREYSVENEISNLYKYELLCKFNQPKKLKKKDFKDVVTRPINLEVEDDKVRIVKGVQINNRERIQIDELTYDDHGNWLKKKTYELKNNKNKRKLVMEIEREIEYY